MRMPSICNAEIPPGVPGSLLLSQGQSHNQNIKSFLFTLIGSVFPMFNWFIYLRMIPGNSYYGEK